MSTVTFNVHILSKKFTLPIYQIFFYRFYLYSSLFVISVFIITSGKLTLLIIHVSAVVVPEIYMTLDFILKCTGGPMSPLQRGPKNL